MNYNSLFFAASFIVAYGCKAKNISEDTTAAHTSSSLSVAAESLVSELNGRVFATEMLSDTALSPAVNTEITEEIEYLDDTPPPLPTAAPTQPLPRRDLAFLDDRNAHAAPSHKVKKLSKFEWYYSSEGQNADLQKAIVAAANETDTFKNIASSQKQSIGVVDLSSDKDLAWAGYHLDREYHSASTAKLAIMLGNFWNSKKFANSSDPLQKLRAEAPTRFPNEMRKMIANSSNYYSGVFYLIAHGESIKEAISEYKLYDFNKKTGLWAGAPYTPYAGLSDFFNKNPEYKKTVNNQIFPAPSGLANITISGHALLRFALLLEKGQLVGPQESRWMKGLMAGAASSFNYSSVPLYLRTSDPNVRVFNKVGYITGWMNELAIVESEAVASGQGKDGKYLSCISPYRYVLVAASRHELSVDQAKQRFGKLGHGINEFFYQRAKLRANDCVSLMVTEYNTFLTQKTPTPGATPSTLRTWWSRILPWFN